MRWSCRRARCSTISPASTTKLTAGRVRAPRFLLSSTASWPGRGQIGRMAGALTAAADSVCGPYELREVHPMTTTSTDRATANLATVADIYAASGRGDVPTILEKVAA